MIERTASVHWEGQGKKGQGRITTETGALKDYPYGFASRFEDDRRGTNPEEILGAAHAAGGRGHEDEVAGRPEFGAPSSPYRRMRDPYARSFKHASKR